MGAVPGLAQAPTSLKRYIKNTLGGEQGAENFTVGAHG
jgi:hypothetical protein